MNTLGPLPVAVISITGPFCHLLLCRTTCLLIFRLLLCSSMQCSKAADNGAWQRSRALQMVQSQQHRSTGTPARTLTCPWQLRWQQVRRARMATFQKADTAGGVSMLLCLSRLSNSSASRTGTARNCRCSCLKDNATHPGHVLGHCQLVNPTSKVEMPCHCDTIPCMCQLNCVSCKHSWQALSSLARLNVVCYVCVPLQLRLKPILSPAEARSSIRRCC
jgi:hypothetical protein